VTIRGKLYGTNTGTSAPLTAPFFGRCWGSTGWGNRRMAGSVGQADFVMPKNSLEAVATIPLSNR